MPRKPRDYAVQVAQKRRAYLRKRLRAEMESRRTKLGASDAITLYRFEKARREERLSAPIALARQAYDRLMALDERRGRGGRPRKPEVRAGGSQSKGGGK